MATREDCIRALDEAANRLGESPTKAQYESLDITPSASTILRHFDRWNAAKSEADLETNASTGSRIEPKPDDVTLPNGVEWESLSQDQRWHYRHRQENTRRSLERRRRLRQWLRDEKSDCGGCERCGEKSPRCLDFHHRDDEPKEMAVNEMVKHGYSKDAIREEVEHCELLCANCHWREHHAPPSALNRLDASIFDDGDADATLRAALLDARPTDLDKEDRVRAWTYAYQRARGCQQCGETDPVCLQFHHVDGEKTAGVGEMIAYSYPVGDVLDEIDRCTVLCANCHRTEHHPARGFESVGNDSV